jgi:uncharacterized protein (DUF2235 family)
MEMSAASSSVRAKKRLALFFDGTWNEPGDSTNVWRLKLMLADRGGDGLHQEAYYDPGVGTHPLDRISGGAFGYGLSDNVRDGYRWLMEHYNEGDEIFLFGFSRGAFTARSLAGVISRCGLLKPDAPMSFMQLYDRYRRGGAARPIYEFKYFGEKPTNLEEEIIAHQTYYSRFFIKMVGVWDTVGSLGLPLGKIKGVSRSTLKFHYTRLSRTVEHSYQALALDEYRSPYKAEIWSHFLAEGVNPEKQRANDRRHIEQRWFAGAHANIGGGYRNDLLPQRPLAWIQQKALNCGLGFRCQIQIPDDYVDDLKMKSKNSYSEFLLGSWKFMTLGREYIRSVMADPTKKISNIANTNTTRAGIVYSANERIDLSVLRRCQLNSDYCPLSIRAWAKRKEIDFKDVISHPEKYGAFWEAVASTGIETPLHLSAAI